MRLRILKKGGDRIDDLENIGGLPNDSESLTFRLSGDWLERWRLFIKISKPRKKTDVTKEALSLLFACTSVDAQGNPVEVVIRCKDKDGNSLPEVDILDYLHLELAKKYIASRGQK